MDFKVPGTGHLKNAANAVANTGKSVAGDVKDKAVDGVHLAGDVAHTTVKLGKSGLDEASKHNPLENLSIPDVSVPDVKGAARGALNRVGDALAPLADIGAMEGTAANKRITKQYDGFDQQFGAYLGEPTVANWTTFGKFASRDAGMQIEKLEQVLSMNPVELGKLIASGPDELKLLLGEYAAPLLADAAKRASGNPINGIVPGGVVAYNLVQSLKRLRDGLAETNQRIYENFGPAFETFLAAENAGQDGVAAVAAKVADGEIEDPSGMLVEALGNYQQAHMINKQLADQPGDPALLAKREALVHQANLLIGMHEQYHMVQPIFAGREFSRLVGKVDDNLHIRDANGTFKLLTADQGSWSDFETRMGLAPLSASEGERAFAGHRNGEPGNKVFRLVDPDGRARYYQVAADEKLPGTIYDYFGRNGVGERAAANRAARVG